MSSAIAIYFRALIDAPRQKKWGRPQHHLSSGTNGKTVPAVLIRMIISGTWVAFISPFAIMTDRWRGKSEKQFGPEAASRQPRRSDFAVDTEFPLHGIAKCFGA